MKKQLPEEWWTNENPSTLLCWSIRLHTPRKLRLFAVECCRGLKNFVNDAQAWQALQTAADFADGKTSYDQLRAAWMVVRQALGRVPLASRWEYALNALLHASSPHLTLYDAVNAAWEAALATGHTWSNYHLQSNMMPHEARFYPPERSELQMRHCQMIRELFPFYPVHLDSHWLLWEHGQLRRLAQAIYDEQRFDDLPVLADALEEAGCDDPRLLEHARSGEPHFR
ncbi:MAG: hypothetical protein SNJ82_09855, partial [Gemmataceae bacterium]